MSIRKPQKKLYYSIRQVSEMSGISVDMLKNWENEFPQLNPMRNRAGNRYYADKDLELVFKIREYAMVYELTPEEIREKLNKRSEITIENEAIELKRILAEVKLEIGEIRNLLDH